MPRNAILYFCKWPEPGKVKTRLGKDIGFEKACQVYKSLARHNYNLCMDLANEYSHMDLLVLFDPPEEEANIRAWLPSASHYISQKGELLGERLRSSFCQAKELGYQSSLALGSDTLGFQSRLLLEAIRYSNQGEIVFGPASDGGYYLIALPSEEIAEWVFLDIPWSSRNVLESSLQLIKQRNYSFQTLETLSDLDTKEDLVHFKGEINGESS